MSKPNYTPGPWFVDMAHRSWADERHLICEVGDRHAVYAKKALDDPFAATEDVRLIAAAPRLLEVMVRLTRCKWKDFEDIDKFLAVIENMLEVDGR